MQSLRSILIAAAGAIVFTPLVTSAVVTFYSDNFNVDTSANYNVFISPGATGPSSDATFVYDYSALGIPSAPHTTDGSTLGLRLRVDNLQSSTNPPNVLGAINIATKTLAVPSVYSVSVDLWGNYIGGTSIAASGTNGTTAPGMGLGTAGTALQSPNANDGLFVETFHDGGNSAASNSDYRVYTNGFARPTPTANPGVFAAGNGAASADNSDPYYAFLLTHTAPAAQVTASPSTQGGTTPVGVVGFAWHTMTLTQDGTNVKWYIDGTLITTVLDTNVILAGQQISLGSYDGGLTGSSAANNQLFNADIFDNLVVTDQIPEPASLAMIALASAGMLARRRQD